MMVHNRFTAGWFFWIESSNDPDPKKQGSAPQPREPGSVKYTRADTDW